MATIEKRKYADKHTGKVTQRYKAKIRLKGFPYEEATFDRKSDAEEWAANREYELRNRQFFGAQAYKTKTVSDLLHRYQESLKATNPKRYKTALPIIKVWEEKIGRLKISDLLGSEQPGYGVRGRRRAGTRFFFPSGNPSLSNLK